jgi:hypothetical protein
MMNRDEVVGDLQHHWITSGRGESELHELSWPGDVFMGRFLWHDHDVVIYLVIDHPNEKTMAFMQKLPERWSGVLVKQVEHGWRLSDVRETKHQVVTPSYLWDVIRINFCPAQ